MKSKEIIILICLTIFGGFLRFANSYSLWVDEAWFGFLAHDSAITQEFIPAYFVNLLGLKSDFGLRFLSMLCGTLTIPGIYYVTKSYRLEIAAFVAVFPLFVFWSGMARPYAVAGLFLVLSWKWVYFMIPALLTTPIALIGLKVFRQKKYILVLIFIIAGVLYFMRGDSDRAWTFAQFLTSSRWWYLPALAIILYFDEATYRAKRK